MGERDHRNQLVAVANVPGWANYLKGGCMIRRTSVTAGVMEREGEV